MPSITSANSSFYITIPGLFAVPQKVQGYTADAAFEAEAVDVSETMVGVDGIMSAGYVPYLTPITVMLNPDSPSAIIFESWIQAEKAAREKYFGNAEIAVPSIQRRYILTNGVISNFMAFASARRVLQGRNFRLTFGDVSPAPF